MTTTTIEVAVTQNVIVLGSAKQCAVVIVNSDVQHIETRQQRINGPAPARFTDVPPGGYYIIVVLEGGDSHRMQFHQIDGMSAKTRIAFDLSVADPVGSIIATVLVDGQGTGGIRVVIRGRIDQHSEECKTDENGIATFCGVPETQKYDVIAYNNGEASEPVICDLTTRPDDKAILEFLPRRN